MDTNELSWEEADAEMNRVDAIRASLRAEMDGLSADYATLNTEEDSLPKWTHENNEQSFNARRGIAADIERVMEKREEVSSRLSEQNNRWSALLQMKIAILKNGNN